MSILLLVFSSLSYVTVFSGCAARRSVQPALPSTPFPSPQQLLATLEERRQTLTGLRGLARVVYADPQEKGTARQAVAVAAPDRFRLEVFSPVGIAALSTCDGQTLAAYFPREKVIYRGAATPLTIARFTRVMLSAREIASLLLGIPGFPANAAFAGVHLDTERGWFRLDLSLPGGGTQVLWFDQKTLLLMRWELQAGDGQALAQIRLADYRKVQTQYFPFEIVLSNHHSQQEVAIYYEQVELNPILPDTLFILPPIAGVQEIKADASAGE